MTALPFMPVAPCNLETDYATGTTVTFPEAGLGYAPKCLKASGATVTFNGDFSMHPLAASATRGTLTGNPFPPFATARNTGTTAPFTFTAPGFYAYWCTFHGGDGDGSFMAGVVWVP